MCLICPWTHRLPTASSTGPCSSCNPTFSLFLPSFLPSFLSFFIHFFLSSFFLLHFLPSFLLSFLPLINVFSIRHNCNSFVHRSISVASRLIFSFASISGDFGKVFPFFLMRDNAREPNMDIRISLES